MLVATIGGMHLVRVLIFECNSQISITDASGKIPLHYAVDKGHLDVVRMLMSRFHTAGVNSADNSRQTPLHYACKNGHTDVLILQMIVSRHHYTLLVLKVTHLWLHYY